MAAKLIVIEGLDASGKGTQSNIIADILRSRGNKVKKLTFPDYDSDSSALVRMYLHGELGDKPDDVNAYAASAFYAVDRVASYLKLWKDDCRDCDYIVADRYVTSNIVYQMTKLSAEDFDEYISWCEDFEYNRLCVPRPSIVIFLDMPLEVSQRLMSKRYCGDDNKKDIHEKDLLYLSKCHESADYACKKLSWTRISCSDCGAPLPVETITDRILETIERSKI